MKLKKEESFKEGSWVKSRAAISELLFPRFNQKELPSKTIGRSDGHLLRNEVKSQWMGLSHPSWAKFNIDLRMAIKVLGYSIDGSLTRKIAHCSSVLKRSRILPENINDSQTTPKKSYMEENEYLVTGEFCTKHSASDIPLHKMRVIGEYLLGDVIGHGAFCKVKEGISTKTAERVAVKIIKTPCLCRGSGSISVIMREIKTHSRLDHENIVKFIKAYAKTEEKDDTYYSKPCDNSINATRIVDFVSGEDVLKYGPLRTSKIYMVLEFCLCTLEEFIYCLPDKKLPEHLCRPYFLQVMHGIEYLHSRYIVHFDIKPSNILLTKDGIVKISDLGLSQKAARYVHSTINTHIMAGTTLFMSPEMIDSSVHVIGEKVDIWACGITLYNMLTGLYPFSGQNLNSPCKDTIFNTILLSPPKFNGSISSKCKDLLMEMLQKDPVDRYGVHEVLSHPWCTVQKSLYIPPDTQYFLENNSETLLCEVCNPSYAQWLSRIHANSILRYVREYCLSMCA